ncbi:MAG: hypothetical protein KAR35_01250 [Candidatus Heimdallarchaeota archaeon]|nr:hypothetical protein [Candidatus Heimdallarchaeota archaeon]MCK5047981.1 hypothetical protein [Candidatus Heimdallarchaeota archaeon]
MNNKEYLNIDHILFSIKSDCFEKLLKLTKILKNTTHRITERPDETYEGIYIMARDGNYVEFLLDDGDSPLDMGFAVSSFEPEKADVDQFSDLYPEIEWDITDQIYDPNNKPWYKAISYAKKEYDKRGVDTSSFRIMIWAMFYQNYEKHRTYIYRKNPKPKEEYTIEELLSCKVVVPESYIPIIKVHDTYLPQKFNQEKMELVIRNASGNSFTIEFETYKGKAAILESITFKMCEFNPKKEMDHEGFRIKINENLMTLVFKNDNLGSE